MSRLQGLLIVGLAITVAVLGFNYYVAITRNSETSRELSRVRLQLREGTAGRTETLKKFELCRSDVVAAGEVSKKLDDDVKKKSQMIAELTKQIGDSRKRESKLKEEVESLNAHLSAANTNAKV